MELVREDGTLLSLLLLPFCTISVSAGDVYGAKPDVFDLKHIFNLVTPPVMELYSLCFSVQTVSQLFFGILSKKTLPLKTLSEENSVLAQKKFLVAFR